MRAAQASFAFLFLFSAQWLSRWFCDISHRKKCSSSTDDEKDICLPGFFFFCLCSQQKGNISTISVNLFILPSSLMTMCPCFHTCIYESTVTCSRDKCWTQRLRGFFFFFFFCMSTTCWRRAWCENVSSSLEGWGCRLKNKLWLRMNKTLKTSSLFLCTRSSLRQRDLLLGFCSITGYRLFISSRHLTHLLSHRK